MAPHLTETELDRAFRLAGNGAVISVIRDQLAESRRKKKMEGPTIWTIRRALKCKTHKRGKKETRGRKRKLSAAQLRKLHETRARLIKEKDNDSEVHMDEVMKKARVTHVAPSTVSKHWKNQYGIAWRPPREKPYRTPEDCKERVAMCKRWKHLPNDYFTDRVDGIMDNKQWPIYTHERARKVARQRRVRGHYRTKSEGLKRGFTRPKSKKTACNAGARVNVCAVIIDCKVKVWHYLPKRWSGAAATKLYEDCVIKALKKHRGEKAKYKLVEDNDPTGFKSKAAIEKKHELGIETFDWPRYSPDLMPHDYWLWTEVARRMGPLRTESQAAYKLRLRKTALAIPKSVVKAAVLRMKPKADEVVKERGGNISSD